MQIIVYERCQPSLQSSLVMNGRRCQYAGNRNRNGNNLAVTCPKVMLLAREHRARDDFHVLSRRLVEAIYART